MNKNTTFPKKNSLRCRGKLIMPPYPMVMGILNLTPDSFYAGSRLAGVAETLAMAEQMLSDGAHILDIGAVSTRPGAEIVSPEDELQRLLPALSALRTAFPETLLSVDTMNAVVASAAADCGADMINDISAGTSDPAMLATVTSTGLPFIIMHMQGMPNTMQKDPQYNNVVKEVLHYLSGRLNACHEAGICDVVIDPGFGFGKTTTHNYELLMQLRQFSWFGCPVLAGVSRKSMINNVLKTKASEALNGTTAVHMLALEQGADILRVHDVKEAIEAIKIFHQIV